MEESSSRRNVLKLVRDLRRRKARERRALVLLEGRRLVEDALGSEVKLVAVLIAPDADAEPLAARAAALGAATETVPRGVFDAVADAETPSGVLAVAEWEPLVLDRLPAPSPGAVALVLDGVQDPGNVGTMIRTAHALGAWCTIALDGTADVRGAKVLRGAMGSHFRHPLAVAPFDEFIAFARARRIEISVAAPDAVALADGTAPGPTAPVATAPGAAARGPTALVVGSEGQGVRSAWRDVPHRSIGIPMRQGAESLNAAVAAGILLFELLRADR